MSDFNRLLRFANLINIPVKFKKSKKGMSDAGYFIYDGEDSEIIVFTKKNDSHTNTMRLLHELGHALHWIEMGRPDVDKLPDYFNKRRLTKKDRYYQWVFEREAVANMRYLHALLGLRILKWELEAEMQFDLWVASYTYRKGKYPTLKECRRKDKEIRDREQKKFETVYREEQE